MAFSFFSAWLTTELAVLHLGWQIVAVVLFVVFGALDSWLGWLGLVITLVSWFGLWRTIGSARRTTATCSAALDEQLGAGWGDALNETWKPTPRPFEWRRVLFPFSFKP